MSKRPPTVYSLTISSFTGDAVWNEYPDHPVHSRRQISAIVATSTKKEAIALFGVTANEFRDYATATGNEEQVAAAMANPGVLLGAPLHVISPRYVPIERRAHVPIPRRKRLPYVPQTPKPTFTREELEAIMERFAMANDPVGQSVTTKAGEMLK